MFRIFPDSWFKLEIVADEAVVTTRSGETFHGKVMRSTLVFPYIIVLRIFRDGRKLPTSRFLFPDVLVADEFRELSVRLKFA